MDATASPHLAMAAVLIAGRLGIEQELPLAAVTDVDPDRLSVEERDRLGIKALPGSMEEAQRLLAEDQDLCAQLPKSLLETYFVMKRQELALTRELNEEQVCECYASLY